MRALLFILLPFIIFNVELINYSIKPFIDFLQKSGYYEVIRSVKIELGSDIAIAFCKEFVLQTNDCKEVVTIYMEGMKGGEILSKSGENEGNEENKGQSASTIEIGLIDLLCQEENLKVINQSYTIKEMKAKIIGILKKQLSSFESNEEIKENIKNILINLDKCP